MFACVIADVSQRHHDESPFRDVVTSRTVGLMVEPNLGTRCDCVMPIDNRMAQPGAGADAHIVHDHAILDLRTGLDHHFTPQDRVAYLRVLHDSRRTHQHIVEFATNDTCSRPLVMA